MVNERSNSKQRSWVFYVWRRMGDGLISNVILLILRAAGRQDQVASSPPLFLLPQSPSTTASNPPVWFDWAQLQGPRKQSQCMHSGRGAVPIVVPTSTSPVIAWAVILWWRRGARAATRRRATGQSHEASLARSHIFNCTFQGARQSEIHNPSIRFMIIELALIAPPSSPTHMRGRRRRKGVQITRE